jgi:hypothetical protein
MHLSSTPCVLHAPPTLLDSISLIIFDEEYKLGTFSLCNFLQSPATSSLLWSKYSPQHIFLKLSLSMFFPYCECTVHTYINQYISVHFNLLFRDEMWRQKILKWTAARIPRI